MKHALGGRLPYHTLLNKELLRLGTANDERATALRKLNVEMISPRLPDSLILDLDFTVDTVYDNQQFAEVGFNSQKRGRKSYQPLLLNERQSRMLLAPTR